MLTFSLNTDSSCTVQYPKPYNCAHLNVNHRASGAIESQYLLLTALASQNGTQIIVYYRRSLQTFHAGHSKKQVLYTFQKEIFISVVLH